MDLEIFEHPGISVSTVSGENKEAGDSRSPASYEVLNVLKPVLTTASEEERQAEEVKKAGAWLGDGDKSTK